jgi:myo-inositol 2-dehydrogenase / D-chiro-inositol 1-dehydrogenase
MTSQEPLSQQIEQQRGYSRRHFLGNTLGAAASASLLAGAASFATDSLAQESTSVAPQRKIKLGLVGCGGRGSWIAPFYQRHGGFEMHAVADYFQPVADKCGDALGVDRNRRFSGLSGYKRVIESGVEAVALIVPPCFLAEQASAAVAAGLHVIMAKPVAVDVPGCLRVEAAGKLATQKQLVFVVDYQLPTDPGNIQVAERVWKGELGKFAKVVTSGVEGGRIDPPLTANIESRLQHLIWSNDTAIGGSFLVSFDIHAIDAAIWLLKQRPVAAMGASRVFRTDPHGDSPDVCSLVFEYADGLIHEHSGLALPVGAHGEIDCTIFGPTGYCTVSYYNKARFQLRKEKPLVFNKLGDTLYPAAAARNVASFYQDITAGRFENPTVRRAVDGCLTCILGREAALRHGRLTMEELLKENKRCELDLSGLKT